MLGKLVGIEDNLVMIQLNVDLTTCSNIINMYVILEDDERKNIGEIVDIKNNIAYVNLVGELRNDVFYGGVINKPSFKSTVKLISQEKLNVILGVDKYVENKHLFLGYNPIYNDLKVVVDINSFFSNHFSIFGSTGSGKSCSVARIIQNLYDKKQSIAYKSNIFIFDAYGEYHTAFKTINEKNPFINFKSYTTNTNDTENELLRIPVWLLGVDDIALLLGATNHTQLPIIEKMLKLVGVFTQDEEKVIKSKNDIIARALMDIFTGGKPASQIRDQITSILSYYNTSELNLDTPIFQPGYTRPLKQCLNIDNTGKIRDTELLMGFLEGFLDESIILELPHGEFKYSLNDLMDALDFSLISEGILNSDRVYEECNVLKTRLHTLVNSTSSNYFDYPEYIDKDKYIQSLITTSNGKKAQIINFNINYIDDRLAKTIVKIYSKFLFEFAKDQVNRGGFPIHLILEEAHRYVQNDNDIFLLGYNIFDRITKEGRKYGVILGMISQRPSEISETALSQCNNFLVFKMLHPKDLDAIKEMVPCITTEIIKKLKMLQSGSCMAFGNAFKVPMFIKFDMPDPAPSSNSCDLSKEWFMYLQK